MLYFLYEKREVGRLGKPFSGLVAGCHTSLKSQGVTDMTQKPEITATAIYKIIGHDCWMVPSDSSSDMHKVCYNNDLNIWECECRHGEEMAKYARNAHCKHVAAVQISIKANLPLSTDQKGYLHSASGKAFSIMR